MKLGSWGYIVQRHAGEVFYLKYSLSLNQCAWTASMAKEIAQLGSLERDPNSFPPFSLFPSLCLCAFVP